MKKNQMQNKFIIIQGINPENLVLIEIILLLRDLKLDSQSNYSTLDDKSHDDCSFLRPEILRKNDNNVISCLAWVTLP